MSKLVQLHFYFFNLLFGNHFDYDFHLKYSQSCVICSSTQIRLHNPKTSHQNENPY